MSDNGTLVVRVKLAEGAYPVEGATVLIRSENEADAAQSHSLRTDRNGSTPPLRLAAPQKGLSLLPSPSASPYTSYSAQITKPGFYPVTVRDISVFPGITATLPVNLIPLAESGSEEVYPRGNLRFDTAESGFVGGGAV